MQDLTQTRSSSGQVQTDFLGSTDIFERCSCELCNPVITLEASFEAWNRENPFRSTSATSCPTAPS